MRKFIQWLMALLLFRGPATQKTLESLKPEEIRRERIKVEQTEARLIREIEDLERQKEAFFQKGVNTSSDRQKLQFCRKIKELDGQIQAWDKQLCLISRNLRVLNGIIQIKENGRVLKELGMDGIVNKMDLSELHSFVEQATVEGQFQMDKFEEILSAINSAEDVYKIESDDNDTLAILDAMNRAAEASSKRSAEEGLAAANHRVVSKDMSEPMIVAK